MKPIEKDAGRSIRFPPAAETSNAERAWRPRMAWDTWTAMVRAHGAALRRLRLPCLAWCSFLSKSTRTSHRRKGEDEDMSGESTARPQSVARPGPTPRLELPSRREHATQKLVVVDHLGRHPMYFTVGFHESGAPAEIFAVLKKTGSEERAFLDYMARAVSLGLQHGVPLSSFVEMFVGSQGRPAGSVIGHPNIKRCQGPIDLLFRWLGLEYCGMKELGHVQETTPL